MGDDVDPDVVANIADGYQTSSDPTINTDWPEWGKDTARVNYVGLIPYMIKAIQELDDANVQLVAALATRDATISDLISRIETLEGA